MTTSKKFLSLAFAATIFMLFFNGQCKNGGNGNVNLPLPTVTNLEDSIEVKFDLMGQEVNQMITVPLDQHIEGAFLELVPSANGNPAYAVLSVPHAALGADVDWEPSTLPDGRALPRIFEEEVMPSISINVENWNDVTFYLGPKWFAFFLPTTFELNPDLEVGAGFSLEENGATVGYLVRVPVDANKANGGFFLALNWPLLKEEIDEKFSAEIRQSDLEKIYINAPDLGFYPNQRYDMSEYMTLPKSK